MILDRYLTKEIVPNFFIGLLIFTFVMLMNQILVLSEILITKGVEFVTLFLIIFYMLPALTVLTVPMSLLLGTLLGLGRLNSDSELTVMRASGISFYRLMVPVLGFATVCWLLCYYLIHVWVPWGNYSMGQVMLRIITTNATSELKPRVFYKEFPNMLVYVQDITTKEGKWNGVLVYDESQPDKARLILARQGTVHQRGDDKRNLELKLENGSWHEVDPLYPQDYTAVYFSENQFPLPMPPEFTGELPKTDRDMTVDELKAKIVEYQKKRIPTQFLEVEVAKKYSIPFACVVFSFLAVTLGFTSRRGTRSSAYAISIGIILLYYVFLITGERFGDAGRVSPWLGAWSANIILGSLGLILFLWSNSNLLRRFLAATSSRFRSLTSRPLAVEKGKRRVRVIVRIQRFPFRLFTLLDKYIVTEFARNFCLILIALVLIAELIEATQLVDDMFSHKVPFSVLLQFLKYHMPQWVFYVVPVAALTTTLVTFGLLTKNSEIIAMKSSGISLYRIALPVIVLASLLSGFAYWLQDYILPAANETAQQYKDILKGKPPNVYNTYERHWIADAEGFYNYDLYDSQKNKMFGLSIYEMDLERFQLKRRVYAREASIGEGKWHLKNGWERSFNSRKVKYETFRQKDVELTVNREYFTTEQELPSQMNLAELKKYIEKMKHRGFDVIRFNVDLQAKLSFPTVSLILTLIAIPFSFTTGKRGALYGIGVSIVMGIVFWFFLALTKSLGYLEILNPFLAAWSPNILAGMLALYLLFKLRT